MHPTILVKRKAEAVARLVSSAEALAETFDLDNELIKGLHPVGTHDNQLREMLLLEGAANLIHTVAIESGAIKADAPVTVVTPTAYESLEGEAAPAADEDLGEPIPIVMGPDGLPAPTLDEAPTADEPVEAIEEEPELVEVKSKPTKPKASTKKPKGRKRA